MTNLLLTLVLTTLWTGCGNYHQYYEDGDKLYPRENHYPNGTFSVEGGDVPSPRPAVQTANHEGLEDLRYTALSSRKINEATCKFWNYQVGTYKGRACQVANYRVGSKTLSKVRFQDKNFWVE